MKPTIARLAVNSQIQAAANNQPALKIGANGEAVRILQQAFIDLGFNMPRSTNGGNSLPDGIWGAETDHVVREFQRINALAADGAVGPLTLKRLEEKLIAGNNRLNAQISAEMRISRPVG